MLDIIVTITLLCLIVVSCYVISSWRKTNNTMEKEYQKALEVMKAANQQRIDIELSLMGSDSSFETDKYGITTITKQVFDGTTMKIGDKVKIHETDDEPTREYFTGTIECIEDNELLVEVEDNEWCWTRLISLNDVLNGKYKIEKATS